MTSMDRINLSASFAQTEAVCRTFASCCELCGAHSMRCARGPASQAFWCKDFFSFSLPIDRVGFWDVVFSFYSMVPYLFVALALLHLLVSWMARRDRCVWSVRLLVLGFELFSTAVRDVIVQLLGDCEHCDRPCASVVGADGMPSGHAVSAIGLCIWLLLETWLGSKSTTQWSTARQILATVLLVLVLAPVPYSRVYLGDHTKLQVAVGSAVGLLLGVIYFLLLRRFAFTSKRPDLLSDCQENESDTAALQVTLVETTSELPLTDEGSFYIQQQSPAATPGPASI